MANRIPPTLGKERPTQSLASHRRETDKDVSSPLVKPRKKRRTKK